MESAGGEGSRTIDPAERELLDPDAGLSHCGISIATAAGDSYVATGFAWGAGDDGLARAFAHATSFLPSEVRDHEWNGAVHFTAGCETTASDVVFGMWPEAMPTMHTFAMGAAVVPALGELVVATVVATRRPDSERKLDDWPPLPPDEP